MPINVDDLRFYVDESALGIGKALTAARRDTVHVGHPLVPECPLGCPDTEWMPLVAARGLVVIGRDKRIRTRPGEKEVLTSHGLRVIRIGGKKDPSTWEVLGRFVRHWESIEDLLASRPTGPWIYLLNGTGLGEVPLVG
jgi:hypothetical protein